MRCGGWREEGREGGRGLIVLIDEWMSVDKDYTIVIHGFYAELLSSSTWDSTYTRSHASSILPISILIIILNFIHIFILIQSSRNHSISILPCKAKEFCDSPTKEAKHSSLMHIPNSLNQLLSFLCIYSSTHLGYAAGVRLAGSL